MRSARWRSSTRAARATPSGSHARRCAPASSAWWSRAATARAPTWRAARSARVALRVDGELALDAEVALVAAANGRQFGGGMRIAPDARLDDGLLDVVCVAGVRGLRLIPKLPKLYRGTLLSDPVVRCWRG